MQPRRSYIYAYLDYMHTWNMYICIPGTAACSLGDHIYMHTWTICTPGIYIYMHTWNCCMQSRRSPWMLRSFDLRACRFMSFSMSIYDDTYIVSNMKTHIYWYEDTYNSMRTNIVVRGHIRSSMRTHSSMSTHSSSMRTHRSSMRTHI